MSRVYATNLLLRCAWIGLPMAASQRCPLFGVQGLQYGTCEAPFGTNDLVGFCSGAESKFCEVFLPNGGVTEVWNTFGCSACPQDDFDAIQGLATGGPWHLQPDLVTFPPTDGLSHDPDGTWNIQAFGGNNLQMRLIGVLTQPAPAAYAEFAPQRTNVLKWAPGRQVYQLIDPSGKVYTMHGAKGEIQFAQDLLNLNTTMNMPPLWTHRCMVLGTGGLQLVPVNGASVVVKDAKGSLYQHTPATNCQLYDPNKVCVQESTQTRSVHCQQVPPDLPGSPQ